MHDISATECGAPEALKRGELITDGIKCIVDEGTQALVVGWGLRGGIVTCTKTNL